MQEFFKRSVKEGKRGKITLRGLLPNATARAAFQEFMVKDSDANTVPFWELTKDGMPGDPQAVFNKYIAETGESQMNLPGPIMAGFTAAKTAGDWTQVALGRGAIETVVAATENDNFPRVKKAAPPGPDIAPHSTAEIDAQAPLASCGSPAICSPRPLREGSGVRGSAPVVVPSPSPQPSPAEEREKALRPLGVLFRIRLGRLRFSARLALFHEFAGPGCLVGGLVVALQIAIDDLHAEILGVVGHG